MFERSKEMKDEIAKMPIPKYERYFYMWINDFLTLKNTGDKIIKTAHDIEGNYIHPELFNKLFYVAKLPIDAKWIKYGVIEFERYGTEFSKYMHKDATYLKSEEDIRTSGNRFYNERFKINKPQTKRVIDFLNTLG